MTMKEALDKEKIECPEIAIGPGVEDCSEGELRTKTLFITRLVGEDKAKSFHLYDLESGEEVHFGPNYYENVRVRKYNPQNTVDTLIRYFGDSVARDKNLSVIEGKEAIESLAVRALEGRWSILTLEPFRGIGKINVETAVPYRIIEKSERTKGRMERLLEDNDLRKKHREMVKAHIGYTEKRQEYEAFKNDLGKNTGEENGRIC